MKRLSALLTVLFALAWCAPAWATIQYNSNNSTTGLDATTAGSLPTGFANGTGTSFTATAGLPTPTAHTHSLSSTSSTTATVLYTSLSIATTDMEVAYTLEATVGSNGSLNMLLPLIRSNSAGTNAYSLYMESASAHSTSVSVQINKLVAAAFTGLSSTGTVTIASGSTGATAIFHVRFSAVGTTLSAKVWLNGTPEPTSWLVMVTDSTYTAGYAGFRAYDAGASGTLSGATDYTINDVPFGETTSIIGYTPYNIANGGTFSGAYDGTAPTGINYALDGASSYTAATGFTASGGNFSFAMPTVTGAYHQIALQSAGATTITSATPAFLATGAAASTGHNLLLMGVGQ